VRASVFLKDSELGKFRRIEAFEGSLKEAKRPSTLKFVRRHSDERTAGGRALRGRDGRSEFSGGESAKSREPSDLTEKQGSYGESVERF
jgi:hypothetical protein